MDRHRQEATGIEVLKEILRLLRITEEYASDGNKTIEITPEEMSIPTLAVYNKIAQTVIKIKSKTRTNLSRN